MKGILKFICDTCNEVLVIADVDVTSVRIEPCKNCIHLIVDKIKELVDGLAS